MKPRKEITLEPESATMSREDQIAILEKRLTDPQTGARECAAISRQLSILKGIIEPGVYVRESRSKHDERKREEARREEQAEQARRNAEQELPEWWNERQCRLHLFWALCDTVSEPDFDGVIESNPAPKNAMFVAINQLWQRLADDVKSKLQQLAVEHRQRSPLSGTEEVRLLDRVLAAFQLSTPTQALSRS